jgi:NADH-quinone oxidoreductase subunit N
LNLELLRPELTLLATAVAVILVDLFIKRKGFLTILTVIGLLVAGLFTLLMWNKGPESIFNNILVLDHFALFFKALLIGISIIVVLSSTDYIGKLNSLHGEYHALILLSTLGLILITSATELITLYVSLEVSSLSLYALTGFLKDQKSSESSLKYLLLGAVSSAVLLYGMALIFGYTGSTQLGQIADAVQKTASTNLLDNPGLITGVALLVAGLGFKIAAVPFHLWVPDVYEGAPTPITGFLSVASKAAGFAFVIRVFYTAFEMPDWLSLDWGTVYAILAVIGMIIGNVSAISQGNIKRLLGYSSIAQAGYLMVGLAALGMAPASEVIGRSSILFFLFSYTLANLGAFAAIIAITNKIGSDEIKDFAGMGKRSPLLALALTVCLISLIGMPPASGFIAKFYIFNSAVQNGLLWLVIIAVLNSVISAFYYLRVVKVMWFNEPTSLEKVASSIALRLALVVTCLGVLFVGIAPGYVLKLAEWAAQMMGF